MVLVDDDVFANDHHPRRLLHRGSAVETLLRAWGPLADGDTEDAEDMLLHGPSGVGKTVLSRHALDRLQEHSPEVCRAHIRCLGADTADVLRAVLADLPGPDPAADLPREDAALALRERVRERGPAVVILDEADDIPVTDVCRRLGDVPGVATVAISHEPDEWLAQSPDRVARRYRSHLLGLDRYGTDELADILDRRATVGLIDDAVTRDQLKQIADEAAGVARIGIQILREAARLAGECDREHIVDDDIEDGIEPALERIRRFKLRSLSFHHQVIYELIREFGPVGAGELHALYEGHVGEVYDGRALAPITEGDRRRKRRKLEAYDLVEKEGVKRHASYKAVDDGLASALRLSFR